MHCVIYKLVPCIGLLIISGCKSESVEIENICSQVEYQGQIVNYGDITQELFEQELLYTEQATGFFVGNDYVLHNSCGTAVTFSDPHGGGCGNVGGNNPCFVSMYLNKGALEYTLDRGSVVINNGETEKFMEGTVGDLRYVVREPLPNIISYGYNGSVYEESWYITLGRNSFPHRDIMSPSIKSDLTEYYYHNGEQYKFKEIGSSYCRYFGLSNTLIEEGNCDNLSDSEANLDQYYWTLHKNNNPLTFN
ncbi:hypothetical protein [Vibrio hangzhouensis]|uniref:hypothetical protein n=1 Tax=Vibrio hangzhouensis TaxID=462991 RepID=UPI001C93768E|nr:hypothetical protein [Vibrio hangzhouensis]MBY6196175.1 hypothetical protein [Vibrio hangzhouensis]